MTSNIAFSKRAIFQSVIASLLRGALLLSVLFGWSRLPAQPSQISPVTDGETKVAVFFGTTKAMDVSEIRTNAMTALKAKGYTVPKAALCVVNITVQGKRPGCAVTFYDLVAKWQYLVLFNGQGQVTEVHGGAMRHGTVGPNDPRPTLPEGGVKVKP